MLYYNRKRNRLKNYDYSTSGAYFVTICTKDKQKILSNIVGDGFDIPKAENQITTNVGDGVSDIPKSESKITTNVGDGVPDIPKIELTKYGEIVEKYIKSIQEIKKIKISKYVIMPNHIHMLVEIYEKQGMSRTPSPTNSIISYTVSTLKRFANKEIGKNIFQRSYHDHVIRTQNDYNKIYEYIETNPLRWLDDCFYIL